MSTKENKGTYGALLLFLLVKRIRQALHRDHALHERIKRDRLPAVPIVLAHEQRAQIYGQVEAELGQRLVQLVDIYRAAAVRILFSQGNRWG